MDDFFEFRKLLGAAVIPEKNERELLKNFQSACPPDARHAAAFRVISNTLHVTEEVVRERMFAMTDESDLSKEDKRLIRSYNIFMDFQMTGDPASMIHMLGRNEAYAKLLCASPPRSEMKSGRKKSLKLGDSRRKSTPSLKLKIRNGSIAKLTEKEKASILKSVFRPPHSDQSRRLSRVTLKSCFVKVFRLSKQKLSNLQKQQKSVAFLPSTIPEGQRLPGEKPGPLSKRKPMPLSKQLEAELQQMERSDPVTKPRSRSISIKRSSSESLAKLDQVLNEVIHNSISAPTSLSAEVQIPIDQPMTIAIEERPELALLTSENQRLVTTTNTLKSPTFQEFSIFDVTFKPKKIHKRPLNYDEKYRRRLSSITSDDEKLTTAVVSSLLSPPARSVNTFPKKAKLHHVEESPSKKQKKTRTVKPATAERATSITPEKLQPRPLNTEKITCNMTDVVTGSIAANEFNDLLQINLDTGLQPNHGNEGNQSDDDDTPGLVIAEPNFSPNHEEINTVTNFETVLPMVPMTVSGTTSDGRLEPTPHSNEKPNDELQKTWIDNISHKAFTKDESPILKSKDRNTSILAKIVEDTPPLTQRKKKTWRKTTEPSSTTRAKIADAKQKPTVQNDKHFRVPINYHTAAALARKVSAETDTQILNELELKSRRDSYHCHWDKTPERKSSLEQIYTRTEKWNSTPVHHDVHPNQQPMWRRLPKHDFQVPNYTTPIIPDYPPPSGFYQPMKSPEHRYSSGFSNFFAFPDIMTPGQEKFSSELTTFNLISDAINQEVSSPTEVIYPLHGVEYGSVKPKSHPGRVDADMYLSQNSSESETNYSTTTSMYVEDALGFYEVFAS